MERQELGAWAAYRVGMTKRIVIGASSAAVVALLWGGMLTAANVRLDYDRQQCTNYVAHEANGSAYLVHGLQPGCIERRESERWGPYHLFGSNGVAGR